jgi:hypothetical protein
MWRTISGQPSIPRATLAGDLKSCRFQIEVIAVTRHLSAVWLLLLLGACRSDAPQHTQTNQTIHRANIGAPTTLLAADGTPVEANSEYAMVAPWGSAMLVDTEDRSVSVFDSLGRPMGNVGRRGDGPGEFRSIFGAFFLTRDTIAVFDPIRRRISFFAGRVAMPQTADVSQWPPDYTMIINIVGRFSDGRWVARTQSPRQDLRAGANLVVDSVWLVAGAPPAEPSRIFLLPLRTRVWLIDGENRGLVDLAGVNNAVASVCDSGIVAVDTSGILRTNRLGRVTSRTSLEPWLEALTPEQRQRSLERLDYRYPGGYTQAAARPLIDKLTRNVKHRLPPVFIASDGMVWVRRGGKSYERVGLDGQADVTVRMTGNVVSFGSRHVITRTIENATDLERFSVASLDTVPSSRDRPMGTCQPMFRW